MENILCSVCGLGFDSQIKLSQHFKTHDKRKLTCPTCGTSVTGNQALPEYKVTGQKGVLIIAKADGIIESRTNLEILLGSLNLGLSETLKVHVITSHFGQYFQKMGTNFCHTNGEYLESAHSSLRISEERHGLKMVRKIGTPRHGAMSERSLIFYNSKRAKMAPPLRRIRSAANSPVSSPIYLQ